jgi:hypothetical protein
MGIYYALSCRQCAQYLSFGKRLTKGSGLELQGLYSEEQGRWIDGEQAFKAVGALLIGHEGHPLTFVADNVVKIDAFEEANVDGLLQKV